MIIQFHLKNVKIAQNISYKGVEDFAFVSKNDEHKLCEDFLSVFANADTDGLKHIQKNAQLGVFLVNTVARIATVGIKEDEEKRTRKWKTTKYWGS